VERGAVAPVESEKPRICRFAAQTAESPENPSCFLKSTPNSWRISRDLPECSKLPDLFRSSRGNSPIFWSQLQIPGEFGRFLCNSPDSPGRRRILAQIGSFACKPVSSPANRLLRRQAGSLDCKPAASARSATFLPRDAGSWRIAPPPSPLPDFLPGGAPV
jgi:hypothetical protein